MVWNWSMFISSEAVISIVFSLLRLPPDASCFRIFTGWISGLKVSVSL